MRQSVLDFQWDRLLPHLKKLGYIGPVRRTRRKGDTTTFVIEAHEDPEVCVTQMGKAQLYANDAYPVTGKGEAVLHLWGWSGSDSKQLCSKVAAYLTRNGIAARPTSYKKYQVVAFDPGNWMNTPEIKEGEVQ